MKKKPFGVAINDSETPIHKTKVIDGKRATVWECKAYKCWNHMLERCYSESLHKKFPTYKDCKPCDDWLLFSKFKYWYDQNYIDGYYLDKDLLFKGNKLYSPETCVFLHKTINSFLVDCGVRNTNALSGATLRKDNGKYRSRCCNVITGNREALGQFDSEVEAHLAWAARKKEIAAMLANSDIHMCERTREALLNIDFSQVKTSEG